MTTPDTPADPIYPTPTAVCAATGKIAHPCLASAEAALGRHRRAARAQGRRYELMHAFRCGRCGAFHTGNSVTFRHARATPYRRERVILSVDYPGDD